jgi:hypothetical protein
MDPAVLLQDLSQKTTDQLLRTMTWTEVGSPLRATMLGRRFLDLGALLVDILHELVKGRTLL